MRPTPDKFPSDEFFKNRPPPFHRYIFIMTEHKTPASSVMAGSFRFINFDGLSEPRRIKELIQKNYGEDGDSLYGKITGYLLVLSPTEGTLLDVEGNEVKHIVGKFWPKSDVIWYQLASAVQSD
jgi:hypothetical protein